MKPLKTIVDQLKLFWNYEDRAGDAVGKVILSIAFFVCMVATIVVASYNKEFVLGLVVGCIFWANLDDIKGWFKDDKPAS